MTDQAPRRARAFMFFLAGSAFALVGVAVALTEGLNLHPCHLCIVQRLLDLLIGMAFLGAAFGDTKRTVVLSGLGVAGVISLVGLGVAGYQSWIQWFPDPTALCGPGETGVLELALEGLGRLWPTLFMASGTCESRELVILGLALSNWSFLGYLMFGASSIALALRQRAA
jgi:protein dithiol:quinone oxidoreductase